MKNKFLLTLLATTTIGTTVFALNTTTTPHMQVFTLETEDTSNISSEEAYELALKDSGVTHTDVKSHFVFLERDDHRWVYDVTFRTQSMKYEYEIDVTSGRILEKEKEFIRTTIAFLPQTATITSEEAFEIALKDSGVAQSEVEGYYTERERDDHRWVYDVVFSTTKAQYEYEIDAASGEIMEKDMDSFATEIYADGAQGMIASENAYEIARRNSGVDPNQVLRHHIELDNDDNILVYEIEFETLRYEYEYEINAFTGAIVDKEVDKRD